jgi:ElaB/YqjD/DUF883 family membrane-anchored ribosome-binding protein
MSEFEEEVRKAEQELEQGLAKTDVDPFDATAGKDEFLGDLRMQAEEYGQKLKDVGGKAYEYATEKYSAANEKFKEIKAKDPREMVEDAKEFARQKPGQTILISAAVGLVLGLILKGGRK